MYRQFIMFIGCIFHNTIHTKDLGNNLRGYGNQFWPRAAPSSFPTQASYSDRRVTVHVFYETLCSDCKSFSGDLMETTLELGPRLDIYLFPYGNAQTIPNVYGGYDFISQHGPEETYGNKLHACAIDVMQNKTSAALFNTCLLDSSHEGGGSDDAAVNKCGALLNVNTNAIKQCANGNRGSQLLKYYGDESKKIGIKWVPTIFVNGAPSSQERFRQDVYRAIASNGRQSSLRGISK